ncbi:MULTISPECIES: restriction endonuclease subunit S [Enterobacteriaceae]|uniref:restriction endonuclease subunit S n=1 Tax=Enterobacteriaceae TaxID=543 RepID=UPI000825D02D|nr:MULTISPECIES: restriction endonuclease subunit S [Enterobacteriaceae]MCD6749600.1 restriction endonuclease subunit S [Escherichia coli]MCL0909428.1 restriction endonuclease subunit S [Escherichia coli]MCL7911051.1 restriction endonuclease subunit S [Escherichia coli]MDD8799780.1 restriction endonuclease subunit S [Escherichia coli]WFM60799.1 restriction endonuclease subunit S [Escherichia coli]
MAFNYEINQLELMQARIKSVPHGWQFTYVGKAFCIRNNLRKPISEEERSMSPGNYPYYGPTKIQGYIGTFEQDGSYALIGEDGDHFLKFEKHSMTQLVDGKCTVNNHAHIIEGTKEASREWFYYYFMHRDIFSFLSRQGAGRYKLNKASLEKMPLLLPPIVEQKKIAQILSTWDKAISVTEKLLTNSQQQKKALMQQLLTGKKRLLDERGGRYGGEWHRAELGAVLDYMQPTPYLVDSTDYNDSYSIPVLTAGKSFILGYTNEEHGIYHAPLPAIIFDDFTTDSKFVDFEFKAKSSAMKILTAKKGVSAKYIFEAMQMLKFKIGGHQRHWISIYSNLVIPIPDAKEQQKIAAVLSAADAEISTLEKKLACLKDEKKALMQQLLTGKRRVKIDEAVAA